MQVIWLVILWGLGAAGAENPATLSPEAGSCVRFPSDSLAAKEVIEPPAIALGRISRMLPGIPDSLQRVELSTKAAHLCRRMRRHHHA